MNRVLLAATALLAIWATTQFAKADTLDDPLHSVVCSGAGTGCVNTDTGSFAPLGQFNNWGFTISGVHGGGPGTGNLTLAILVPTNQIDVTTFTLPSVTDNSGSPLGSLEGSKTTLFTMATGASLSAYLQDDGLLAAGDYSPTDNFSNASAGEATENPGFTGAFLAFTVTLPNVTLNAQGSTTILNDFSFGTSSHPLAVPAGTVVVGFLAENAATGGNFVGTAASEDLVVTPAAVAVPSPIVGAGLPGLFGLGMLWLARLRQKRNGIAV